MATDLTGKVTLLTADTAGAFIRLDNDPSIGPKDNGFQLKLDHPNYNALYHLQLLLQPIDGVCTLKPGAASRLIPK